MSLKINSKPKVQPTKTEVKAKKYFKTYAYTIIADIRTKLEKNQLYHILPSLYIKQFVENVKGNLTQSYREMIVKLSQVAKILVCLLFNRLVSQIQSKVIKVMKIMNLPVETKILHKK